MNEHYGCPMADQFWLNFNGRVEDDNFIAYCCETIEKKPSFSINGESALATLMEMIEARLRFINEGCECLEQGTQGGEYTSGCINCAHYRKMQEDVNSDGRIHYINLSMYPSPCQSKCMYCNVHQENQAINTPELKEAYERIFELIEYALRCGVIAPNAAWQVSCGEITIHPYKERILKLVENRPVMFYTNCFKFDPEIAAILKNNPNAAINLSIDAGTPKTWHRVKGVDNFEQVAMNLTQYSLGCSNPNQITLKYIVLPGINDTKEDYLSLIEMMKILKITHLTLSRDTSCKYQLEGEERQKLIDSAAILASLCCMNKISNDMFTYTPEERVEIVALAKKMLKAN